MDPNVCHKFFRIHPEKVLLKAAALSVLRRSATAVGSDSIPVAVTLVFPDDRIPTPGLVDETPEGGKLFQRRAVADPCVYRVREGHSRTSLVQHDPTRATKAGGLSDGLPAHHVLALYVLPAAGMPAAGKHVIFFGLRVEDGSCDVVRRRVREAGRGEVDLRRAPGGGDWGRHRVAAAAAAAAAVGGGRHHQQEDRRKQCHRR
jgi:hypothetical protein